MKHSLTLHYSVRNGGDGSAYPTFMSSGELVEYDQANMDEGWGESCTGSITLESDSPIFVKEEIETPESYLIELIDDDDEDKINEFVAKFFPNGKPVFRVELEEVPNQKPDYKYIYNNVFVGDKKVAKVFKDKKNSGGEFEKLLNE